MNCRGCDQPILFGTYCPKCDEEVRALLAAQPLEFPQWAIITCKFLACLAIFLLIAWIFITVGELTPDTSY